MVTYMFMGLFTLMIGYFVYFEAVLSENVINNPYNARQEAFAEKVIRGSILAEDGTVLAETKVAEDGTETRVYPYAERFAHVVGYSSRGRTGIENLANFSLLTSDISTVEQIQNDIREQKDQGNNVVTTLNVELQEAADTLPINTVEMKDTKIGVITSGIPYQYVKEALPNASVLKLGMVNPLPRKMIEEFASKVEKLYIVEELDPVIEEQVKSWGIQAVGKEIFTVQGEYSANMIRAAIGGEKLEIAAPAAAPGRPPILCPGCPHRSVYYVLNKLKLHAAGDIGCYTLGAVAPLSVVDTTICMGASISSLHGMEKAKGKEYIKDWVAVIGDSTFLHTGVNSLMNMMYNNATGTVIILDNSTTGMTGHQDHAATGKTLQGDPTYAIDIPGLCRAMGVKNVVEVNAFDIETLEKTVKEEVARDEVSVIITKTPCVLLSKAKKPLYVAHEDKCKKCGMCMKPGCPAMTKNPDGTIHIDDTMCTGCGLCASLCKFDAIELVKEGER